MVGRRAVKTKASPKPSKSQSDDNDNSKKRARSPSPPSPLATPHLSNSKKEEPTAKVPPKKGSAKSIATPKERAVPTPWRGVKKPSSRLSERCRSTSPQSIAVAAYNEVCDSNRTSATRRDGNDSDGPAMVFTPQTVRNSPPRVSETVPSSSPNQNIVTLFRDMNSRIERLEQVVLSVVEEQRRIKETQQQQSAQHSNGSTIAAQSRQAQRVAAAPAQPLTSPTANAKKASESQESANTADPFAIDDDEDEDNVPLMKKHQQQPRRSVGNAYRTLHRSDSDETATRRRLQTKPVLSNDGRPMSQVEQHCPCPSKYHARFSDPTKHGCVACHFCSVCHLLETVFNGNTRQCRFSSHHVSADRVSRILKKTGFHDAGVRRANLIVDGRRLPAAVLEGFDTAKRPSLGNRDENAAKKTKTGLSTTTTDENVSGSKSDKKAKKKSKK
eukprot:PhM_4_TR1465/c0_g1_i1/m.59802